MKVGIGMLEQVAPIHPEALKEARGAVPSGELLRVLTDTFQVLADPTRLTILYALAHQRLCVRDLALLVGVSESAVSHQLRFLRDRGLVRASRHGKVIYYEAVDHHLPALFREAEYHADHLQHTLPEHPYPAPEHGRTRHER